jgi:hypothetical protein
MTHGLFSPRSAFFMVLVQPALLALHTENAWHVLIHDGRVVGQERRTTACHYRLQLNTLRTRGLSVYRERDRPARPGAAGGREPWTPPGEWIRGS